MVNNLKELIRDYGDESMIYMPNNIFNKLSNMKEKQDFKNSSFTYSYLVISGFLYKYAMYLSSSGELSTAETKELLGYSKTTKTVNYIIKKGGWLEENGYIELSKTYPTSRYSVNNSLGGFSHYEFNYITDEDYNVQDIINARVRNKGYLAPIPIFMLEEARDEDKKYGKIKEPNESHSIKIKELIHFLEDPELDLSDFMMYCFLKSHCSFYKNKICKHLSYELISDTLGASPKTISKIINKLQNKKLVIIDKGKWVKGAGAGAKTTTYQVRAI